MINPINNKLLEKLKNRKPLTEEDLQLLYENEEFLECLLTWLHYDEFNKRYEAIIDEDCAIDYITNYMEERGIE